MRIKHTKQPYASHYLRCISSATSFRYDNFTLFFCSMAMHKFDIFVYDFVNLSKKITNSHCDTWGIVYSQMFLPRK